MQTMTSQQKLEYAKTLQKIYNLYIIKENLYFAHQNKNYNKAAKQIETVIEKQLKNSVTAAIDGTIDLQKDINTEHIITTALKSQHKMLTRQDDRYLRTATKNNIKTYNKILQNRIEKESVSLQSKIEAEATRSKYKKLSSDEAKRILNSKFEGVGTKRAKNIVRDALHTNESNLSWIANLNNDYKYKIWMNGRGKGKVRPWHRAKQIQACYIDDYFDIYGSYHAQMMYPGDLNGGAENVANCRCWIQYTNTPPSNLKTKGTIQVNPNVKLQTTNKKRYTQNNYSLISNIKNKATTAISNIKNKLINIKNKTVQPIKYNVKKIINKGQLQYTTDDNKHSILIKEVRNPKKFKEKLIEAYNSQPKKDAWRVDLGYTPEDYLKYDCKMYITKNGSIVAIKPDGDIISVCANINGKKDSTRALLEFATKNGGTKLDSYDGNYGFYRRCGFKPVSYCLGEEDYYPDAWKKGRKEKQDEFEKENIMFFIYNGKPILKAKLEDWYVNDKKKSLAKNYSDAESKRDEVLEEWKKKGIL